ncbi:glutathione S-transferase [Marinomonas pollencensis]|uniref:glutathione transferase n=1 Tax=Marinomonas pollencensis TaxID=491954 RepID=A0A3E0DHH5_9GAMM|nr:glutathione S-transferase [Marinomonas pollencensis]REG81425.1 glutathione S-transferase [Marinomonas pollencensis]
MITLHHLEKSRSQRILWLLEELGLEYRVILYERDPKTMAAPESLADQHPLAKAPILTDGTLTVAESGAIIEYLIDQYDSEARLRPTQGQALLDYRYWLHFAEGSLMPLLVMKLVLTKMANSPMPFFIKPVAKSISAKLQSAFVLPRLLPQLAFIEQTLAHQVWFTGASLSGADIQMSFPLMAASARLDLSQYPNIARFIEQVEASPSFQQAADKVGGFATL